MGILELTLPKLEDSKRRTITISRCRGALRGAALPMRTSRGRVMPRDFANQPVSVAEAWHELCQLEIATHRLLSHYPSPSEAEGDALSKLLVEIAVVRKILEQRRSAADERTV